jgi:hypothetical protein
MPSMEASSKVAASLNLGATKTAGQKALTGLCAEEHVRRIARAEWISLICIS